MIGQETNKRIEEAETAGYYKPRHEATNELATDIMILLRRKELLGNVRGGHSDEQMDEFEALCLAPLIDVHLGA